MGIVYVKRQEDMMNFGKYANLTVGDVLELNPNYIVWACDNIEWFKVTKAIYEEAVEKAVQDRFGKFLGDIDWGIDYQDDIY